MAADKDESGTPITISACKSLSSLARIDPVALRNACTLIPSTTLSGLAK